MKDWKHTLNFKLFYHNDDISLPKKGVMIAEKLETLANTPKFEDDMMLWNLVDEFKAITGDGEPPDTTEFTELEDFNARMSDLYDWCDANAVWVETGQFDAKEP